MVFKMKIGIKNIILVSLFSSLMVVGAYVRIPFPLLPVTLQPFFCAFAGLILGSRLGAVSQIIYIFLGLVGLPVFAEGSGILYVLRPSFGFLLGFILGAYIIGEVSEILGTFSLKTSLISVLSGLISIYILGEIYMFIILRFYMDKQISLGFVIAFNLPYMLKDLVLYIVVAISAGSILPALRKAGHI